MPRSLAAFALAMSFTAHGTTARAQQADAIPKAVCFRGQPLPRCRAFWLTEFGVAAPLGGSDPLASWELGGMRNIDARTALGVTLYLSAFASDGFGVKPRLRRWLSPRTALDVSPGIFYAAGNRRPGFTGHVGLSLGDWLSLTVQAQTVQADFGGGGKLGWFAGGKLGALPGTVSGVGFPLVALLAFVIACRGGACAD